MPAHPTVANMHFAAFENARATPKMTKLILTHTHKNIRIQIQPTLVLLFTDRYSRGSCLKDWHPIQFNVNKILWNATQRILISSYYANNNNNKNNFFIYEGNISFYIVHQHVYMNMIVIGHTKLLYRVLKIFIANAKLRCTLLFKK